MRRDGVHGIYLEDLYVRPECPWRPHWTVMRLSGDALIRLGAGR